MPTIQEQIDSLVTEVTQLQNTIVEHKSDPATIDYDKLAALFAQKYQELSHLQGEAGRGRRGESTFEDVGPDGQRAPVQLETGATVRGGRYDGMRVTDLYLTKRFLEEARRFNDRAPGPSEDLVKAMDSTTSGSGDQFVPTLLANEIWEQVYLESRIAASIGPIMDMPSDPWDVPLWSTYTWYKASQNTATTASNPTTAKSTMTTTELIAEVNWSYTLDEDSIIPMMPNLRSELVRSGAEEIDDFILNADATNAGTGNINLDDADPADTKTYLSAGQDGLRHYWIVDVTDGSINAGGDALTDTDILNALAQGGKYMIRPGDAVMIPDITTYFKGLLNLDGVQTLDKYGPNAVLLTGELARYRGVPIVVSESAPLTEADGKVSTTSGNNTLGQLTIANRRMWMVGARRRLLIEVDRDIQKRQMLMVASMRVAVGCRDNASRADGHTVGVRNILVS
jgi:HK97 family phage major capsid protein